MRIDGDRLHSLHRTNFELEAKALGDLLNWSGVPAMTRPGCMPPGCERGFATDLARWEVCIYRRDLDRALQALTENAGAAMMLLAPTRPQSISGADTGSERYSGSTPNVAIVLAGGCLAFTYLPILLLLLLAGLLQWMWRQLHSELAPAGSAPAAQPQRLELTIGRAWSSALHDLAEMLSGGCLTLAVLLLLPFMLLAALARWMWRKLCEMPIWRNG